MFVYQNNKLFVETKGKLVGVSITPTSLTLVDETTSFLDGDILTDFEVRCRFGEYYTFPSEVGEVNDSTGTTAPVKSTTRRKRTTV